MNLLHLLKWLNNLCNKQGQCNCWKNATYYINWSKWCKYKILVQAFKLPHSPKVRISCPFMQFMGVSNLNTRTPYCFNDAELKAKNISRGIRMKSHYSAEPIFGNFFPKSVSVLRRRIRLCKVSSQCKMGASRCFIILRIMPFRYDHRELLKETAIATFLLGNWEIGQEE